MSSETVQATTRSARRWLTRKTEQDQASAYVAFRSLVTSLSDRDALSALRYVGVLRRWLEDIEVPLVVIARGEGADWAEIARSLGRSRQAVWKWYRAKGLT